MLDCLDRAIKWVGGLNTCLYLMNNYNGYGSDATAKMFSYRRMRCVCRSDKSVY